MNTNALVMAAAASLLASPANAQDWYISGGAGVTNPSSTVFNDGTNGSGNPKVDIDLTGKLNVAVGRSLNSKFRVELEYSRAKYNTDDAIQSGSGTRSPDTFATDAEMKVGALMLNAIYDFKTESAFTPFVELGVGQSFYEMEGGLFVSSSGGNTFGGFLPATFDYEGSGSNFAYQVGLGTSYAISDAVALTADYSYGDFGTVATDFDANGDRLQTDLKAQTLTIGLRYTFN